MDAWENRYQRPEKAASTFVAKEKSCKMMRLRKPKVEEVIALRKIDREK
jgi:hypothetical protein